MEKTIDKYQHIDDDTISNDAAPPARAIEQTDVAPAPEREGLKLLFAASKIETDMDPQDKAEDADVEANGASQAQAQAQAQVASSITVVSNGTVAGAADLESGNGGETGEAAAAYFTENDSEIETETENLAIAALENQEKSFPQILHEILATTECQPILHWLPDGFSFLIVDKQRFSSEILPQYFRGALLNSFIRKLNRWGFRRVKSRFKGEESSFAHRNFVRDKPWLCMKMRCKSKPSYHKVPSAKKATQKKKKTKQKSTAITEASDGKSLAAPAAAGIVVPTKAPPPFLATNGTDNGAFVPTFSRMAISEHEPLPLPDPHRNPTLHLPKAAPVPVAPARFLSAAGTGTSTMQERQHDHPHQHLVYHQHQQRIFHERQILIAQMHRRHQLQVEMQRLNQMSSLIAEQQFDASSRAAQQRAMMAKYSSDMLKSSLNYHRGGRK